LPVSSLERKLRTFGPIILSPANRWAGSWIHTPIRKSEENFSVVVNFPEQARTAGSTGYGPGPPITNHTNGACRTLMSRVFPENRPVFTRTDTNLWFDSIFRSSLFVVFVRFVKFVVHILPFVVFVVNIVVMKPLRDLT
jgi:hypothetical protein